ncbi:MAG: hypothetical protein SFU98_14260 [Leptospiraceae bacterium]|nr:hypothetical protein [Leptospiraceae bacterium]
MKRKLKLILPLFSILISAEALFMNIQIVYDIPQRYQEFFTQDKAKKETGIEFNSGTLLKLNLVNESIQVLKDPLLSSDVTPEKTIESLEKLSAGLKLFSFFYLFLLFLSITSFISYRFNTWFAPFMNRFLFLISAIISFGYLFICMNHMVFAPLYAFPAVFWNLVTFGLFVWGFRDMKFEDDFDSQSYKSLYMASFNDEENNSGKITVPIPRKIERSDKSFLQRLIFENFIVKFFTFLLTNKILRHFAYIIFTGLLLGNLVYIPLFSLQKHYTPEFGVLLFVMLVLLCIFYVINYNSIGKDKNPSSVESYLVSTSFLQFRFLRNAIFLIASTFMIVLFIVVLFLILNFNSEILKSTNLIEKSTHL